MGFEPTRRDHRPAAFRERSLRPLGYISRHVYPPENGKNWRMEQQEQDVSKSPESRINKGFSSIPLLKNLLNFECDLLRPLEYISVSYGQQLYSIRNGAFAQAPIYSFRASAANMVTAQTVQKHTGRKHPAHREAIGMAGCRYCSAEG